jgi:LPS export ABC transporter protein LptC
MILKTPMHTITQQTKNLILLLITALMIISCESNKPEEIKAVTNLQDIPALILTNLETVVNDSGTVKYKFITPELYQYDKKQQPYIDFPKGLTVIIYTKTGDTDAKIQSKWAKYLVKEKLWELKNDVVAVNQKGDILNTEQLFWNENKESVYSELYTKITTKTQILTGIGFESNQTLTKYIFHKPQGIFEIENK